MTSPTAALHSCRGEAPKSLGQRPGHPRTANPSLSQGQDTSPVLDSPPCIHSWFWEGSLSVNYHFPLSISCISDEDAAHTVTCNNQVTSRTPANPGVSGLIQKRISGWANVKQRWDLLNEILIQMLSPRVKRERNTQEERHTPGHRNGLLIEGVTHGFFLSKQNYFATRMNHLL